MYFSSTSSQVSTHAPSVLQAAPGLGLRDLRVSTQLLHHSEGRAVPHQQDTLAVWKFPVPQQQTSVKRLKTCTLRCKGRTQLIMQKENPPEARASPFILAVTVRSDILEPLYQKDELGHSYHWPVPSLTSALWTTATDSQCPP
ncbi:hypothetical protein INR49_007612, partial [Caranx melampygus]